MIIGVGIDIVKIDKLQRAIDRWGQDFLTRIYNQEELTAISQGKMYYQRLAARFAAKEAVFKAVSSQYNPALKDVSIFNHENGAPYCLLRDNKDIEIMLSISHIQDYAVACAVAQKKS